MWFLGLLVGMSIGGMTHGFEGALSGAVLGLLAGLWAGARHKKADASAGNPAVYSRSEVERIRVLEAQVEWLHRETRSLRGELALLRGEAPTADEIAGVEAADAIATETLRAEPLAANAVAKPSEAGFKSALGVAELAAPVAAEKAEAPAHESFATTRRM